jgi:hypothetical protein
MVVNLDHLAQQALLSHYERTHFNAVQATHIQAHAR